MINKENVEIFNSKIMLVLNNIIPGIVLLEIFFKNGFFSKTPENLYLFIIYLVWAFLLSIPFNIFSSLNLKKNIRKVMNNQIEKVPDSEKMKMKEDIEIYFKKEKEDMEVLNDSFEFGFNLLYVILTYVIYKFIDCYFILPSFWKLNQSFINLFICLFVVFIITIPIRIIIDRLLYNYLKINIFKPQ
ncbi:hypothetical protein ABF176_000149 [Flavobacterium psychrophilum]|uniref:hypothetical protein n=1 Tax=Flavobacterium psychrophilum TaxID=96345 RepID=UPI000B7C1CB4|nr:hypothetical protein [Flavobacterium psychrophilum]EKT4501212.1 hypothetical protein [Flavobacterium psychrophilum]SNB00545.1 membrane hypothetical protein [Flavobacterium psychrophilum]